MRLRPIIDLLRHEPRARIFFAARAQSSLGTGAAYVGLLVLAYDRLESPWAIGLVLLADFLPAMFLGSILGAAADRWSPKFCVVIGDLIRAVAFVCLALVGGFVPTIALALLAGLGTAFYNPAAQAALPGLVTRDRLPAATSLYGALADLGFTLAPALAGVGLLLGGPEFLMVLNGASFAVSAVVLARLRFGAAAASQSERSLLAEAAAGTRSLAKIPGLRTVVLATSSMAFCGALFNVGEFLLATDELGAGGTGYSMLVGALGLGLIAGSVTGASSFGTGPVSRRYLWGLGLTGVGFIACSAAPVYAVALPAFVLAGVGNGILLVHDRLLLQELAPERLLGCAYGLRESLTSWGCVIAFAGAGGAFATFGTRPVVAASGAGLLVAAAVASWSLRPMWRETGEDTGSGLPALVDRLETVPAEQPAPAGAGV